MTASFSLRDPPPPAVNEVPLGDPVERRLWLQVDRVLLGS